MKILKITGLICLVSFLNSCTIDVIPRPPHHEHWEVEVSRDCHRGHSKHGRHGRHGRH